MTNIAKMDAGSAAVVALDLGPAAYPLAIGRPGGQLPLGDDVALVEADGQP